MRKPQEHDKFEKLKAIPFGGVRNAAGRETDIEKILRYLKPC